MRAKGGNLSRIGRSGSEGDTGRGERVNGGHVRDMQNKIKNVRKVENLHKRAFSLKGVLLKYAA
jgi:hypothetical protein